MAGLPWQGTWKPLEKYAAGDLVEYQGSVFKARVATTCLTPGNYTENQRRNWAYICEASEINWSDTVRRAVHEVTVSGQPEGLIQFYDQDGNPIPHRNVGQSNTIHFNGQATEFGNTVIAGGGGGGGGEIITYPPDPDRPFVRYDPQSAQDITLRDMNHTSLTVSEVAELRRRLQEALRARAEYQTIATRAVDGESRAQNRLLEIRKKEREALDLGPAPRETRIGDTIRNRYIEHLSNMLSDGTLAQDEFEDRMNKAAEAKYERELKELIADLPPLPPPFDPKPALWVSTERQPALIPPLAWMEKHKVGAVATAVTLVSVGALMWLFLLLWTVLL